MAVDVILGLQWGDEGKGKIVDYLADKYDMVCRFQGGPNPGHTLPTHRYIDAASEAAKGKQKIGSTLKGIGPTYMDKTGRNGLRVGDIETSNFKEKYEALKAKHMDFIKLYPEIEFDLAAEEKKWFDCINIIKELNFVNGEYMVNKAIKEGKKVLALLLRLER